MIIDGSVVKGHPNKTILQVAEEHGLHIESHCRQGFCGACRKRKLSGDTVYSVEPIACFDENAEVITCCASSDCNVVLSN